METNKISNWRMHLGVLEKVETWLYKYKEQQLHFFWAFSVTTLAVFWQPLLISGLMITIAKELWDWKSYNHNFSLKDLQWGTIGWIAGLLIVGA